MKKSGKIIFLFILLLIIPLNILSSDKKTQLRRSQTEINYIRNSIGQEFVYIKPGDFLMGSPENEPGRSYDEKMHRVIISKGFYMQTTEVTRKQWFTVMKTKPWLQDRIKQKGWNYPVTYVSWYDAKSFIKKLNQRENTDKYRLPTEAEWEYSCRAGTTTKYSFGNDETNLHKYAWFKENVYDLGKLHCQKVKLKRPNPWGLYDMHGNVVEMCEDKSNNSKYYGNKLTKEHAENVINPLNKVGLNSIVRGGSWLSNYLTCRSANRDSVIPDNGSELRGFRIVKSH